MREKVPQNNKITDTHSTYMEMKNNFQTEDTLNNKDVEGSATENLKCFSARATLLNLKILPH